MAGITKYALKCRNSALVNKLWLQWGHNMQALQTCKRSSKLRAARCFMAATSLWNHRIVPRPNVGTWRYLLTSRSKQPWKLQLGSYLQLSSGTTIPPTALRMRRRWVKIAFHTLSSNSWSRSTRKTLKKLTRNSAKCIENAFCQELISNCYIHLESPYTSWHEWLVIQ